MEDWLTALGADGLIAVTLALGASPLVALARASRPVTASASYRDMERRAEGRGAPEAGALILLSGVVSVVAAPFVLVLGLLSSISLTGNAHARTFVFATFAALAGVTLGPGLVVAGRRIRRGLPTTRIVAAASAVHVHVLHALVLLTFVERSTVWPVGAAALALTSVGLLVGAMALRAGSAPDDAEGRAEARRRLGLAAGHVAVVIALGAVLAGLLADEIGDRTTTRPDATVYAALLPHAWAGCGLSALAALGAAVASLLAWRSSARG